MDEVEEDTLGKGFTESLESGGGRKLRSPVVAVEREREREEKEERKGGRRKGCWPNRYRWQGINLVSILLCQKGVSEVGILLVDMV
jgi:hypothetical protein